MGNKNLVLAPPAAITASGPLGHYYSNPSLRSSTYQVLEGLEVEYFEYYPHLSVLAGEVRHGLELTKNE
jgi:hypothetical protein